MRRFDHLQQTEALVGRCAPEDRYIIVLSTVIIGGQAVDIKNSSGGHDHYNIMNPGTGDPIMVLYHETVHNLYSARRDTLALVESYSQYRNALREPRF